MTEALSPPLPRPAQETIPVFSRWLGSWQLSIERRALSVGELTRRYDRAALDWDRTIGRLGFPDAYATLLRRVLDRRTIRALSGGGRVLDCGTGTGAMSLALRRVSAADFEVDALDASPRMLDHARRRLREAGVDATLHLHGHQARGRVRDPLIQLTNEERILR